MGPQKLRSRFGPVATNQNSGSIPSECVGCRGTRSCRDLWYATIPEEPARWFIVTPSSGPEPTAALDSTRSGKEPVIVHVLFLDIVGSSSQPSDLQQRTTSKLQEVVMGTREFLEERARGDLISIPTGDGMALVFLRNNPELPLRCGIEIARAVRANPFCKIRMGVNSGLVFFTFDINGNQNVSGAGINLAERIMSCGGRGQLLVSNSTAESLGK